MKVTIEVRSRPKGEYRWRTDFHMEYGDKMEVQVKILHPADAL